MQAYEGFIARATSFNSPFALKGSFLTRQFCANPANRLPADLDWYCTQTFGDIEDAEKIFNIWLMTVCHSDLKDGVRFKRLDSDNIYWENSDYAMYNHFATVNTEIKAFIGDEKISLNIEISFNWSVPFEPVTIEYQPAQGAKFIVPKAAPLPIQLSWKMHQCIIEPRVKDFVDLYLLLENVNIDAHTENLVDETTKYLLAELKASDTENYRVGDFFSHNFANLFYDLDAEEFWEFWRNDMLDKLKNDYWEYTTYSDLYQIENFPYQLSDFWALLANTLATVGFTREKIDVVLE